jgi:dipeptidyl aminopeptidase/acylaminoacyl peptidase
MKYLAILIVVIFAVSCSTTEQKIPDQYTIEQFYQNTRNSGGKFSEDESKLLISSDESGIFNLYEINIAEGSKKQISFSDEESFFAIDYVPGSKHILYSSDKGGNEINHIYLLKEDSTTIDLTPGENEKAHFSGWSEDKKSMFYISNKRDPRFFDLYKMSVGNWQSELIYQNDDGYNISGRSHNEDIICLTKSITTSENKLFLYSISNQELTEISDLAGEYGSAGFSKDDKEFYFITNADKEFAYLVNYNIESKEKSILFEANWDVMYSYLSENEKYRVIAINEDGKNKLIIQDNKSKTDVDFPEISDGDIVGVNISESEKYIRLTIGTSKSPNNIYVYGFETKELKKLTESLNPDIDPNDLVSAEVVRFKSFDGLEIPAIYYKPLIASEKNKVPALVWVHGGPGGQSRVGYFALVQYLINHGYAILAVNNRGSSGYGKSFYKMDDLNHGDKDLKDCIWGKKWLQEQNYIDSNKIGIIGGSYGGYMTMAAMTFTPDEFEVGVNIFGVTNWLRTLKSIPPYWEAFRKALYAELGDPFTADSVRLFNISPLFHAENVKKPILVLQGANDPRVLQVESDEIVEAVKKNNVPVEYIVFPDEGHGFVKKENEIKGYGQILTFLDKYLKEKPLVE